MAKDLFHDGIRYALEKSNWLVTHDPYIMRYEEVTIRIDLGAQKIIAAEKDGRKIAVEIKSFLGRSPMYDFHAAVGQFSNYLSVLRETEPDRWLFLAIPQAFADSEFFNTSFVRKRLREEQINVIVFDPESEEIISWIVQQNIEK